MAQPQKRSLAVATAILMAAFVASRLTGLARDIVIGYHFGTTREYDAYLAAIRVPDLVFQILAGGAVASAFIPVFASYLAKDREDEAWRMVSTLFNLGLLALTPIVVLLAVFAEPVMAVLAPGFEPEAQALAADLARVLLVMPLFFTLGALTTSVLNSHHRFLFPALAPSCYNLGILSGAWLLGPSMGVKGMALGASAGAFLYLLVQVPGLARLGMTYRPVLDLGQPGVRQVGKLMAPRVVGLGIVQVNSMIALVLASALPGMYSALNYAWLLTMLPLGVFAIAISTAAFPTMAAQVASERTDEMKRVLSSSLRLILYLTVPASIGLIVLRYPVVRLLFERGQFDASSTEATAFALQFYAAGLFAHSLTEIVTRAFYAMQDTRTPVAVAGAAMVVNLAASWFLVQTPLRHGGLALGLSLSAAFEALLLLWIIRQRLGGLDERQLALSVVRIVAASVVMGLVVGWAGQQVAARLGMAHLQDRLAVVMAGVAVGGASYLVLTLLLGSSEVQRLRSLLPVRS